MELSRNDGLWIERKVSTAELAANPSQPINQTSTNWASAKAAYRFFDNPRAS